MEEKLTQAAAARRRAVGLPEEVFVDRHLLFSPPAQMFVLAFSVASGRVKVGHVFVRGVAEGVYRPLGDSHPGRSLSSVQVCTDVPVVYCLQHRWSATPGSPPQGSCDGILRVDLTSGREDLWNPWSAEPFVSPTEVCAVSNDEVHLAGSVPLGPEGPVDRLPTQGPPYRQFGLWRIGWSTRRVSRVGDLPDVWF